LVTIAAGGTSLLAQGFFIAGGAGIVDEETTITRTIGQFAAQLDLGTAGLQARYGIGMVVARNEAIAAGTGSLPSALSDQDAEWLYYATGSLERGTAADTFAGPEFLKKDFDVRGQRIVRAGSSVVWICAVEGAAITVSVHPRYLLKLT